MTEIRRAMGMSQEAFGAKIGVSQRAISGYETGTRKPSPAVAKRIGAVLELTTEELWEMFYAGDERRCG